ncbi:alpha-amylase family glycosyl hydrolase [Deinococcus maricopensis]|uniref:Cyclomaltodextrin glucanotransferase n=1 Tax=Deinococcus maricopensis (strain DSM 21211 / LMG 22137 / NRRL B-23946 / LB-34) TaxID=709986 RepID=E8UA27_DEIML|nr:alpha-amylase family glycosyl hydrolase [Deinococcus maricopensis]ADV67916.1 Cyclomaltodextrin glucanotransferase [Deinococcus maricopensis DSM 21211]
MKRFQNVGRASALVGSMLLLGACTPSAPRPPASTTDWRQDVIYFAVTDRFADGNGLNNAGVDRQNPLGWHGGDLRGLTEKIRAGYFQKLGFTAVWITPVQLQVPGTTASDGPNKGRTFAGYHGYWADDFMQIDPHFGTVADLKEFVQAAHRAGLKVIQDVVVNHAGYGSRLVTQHPEWFHTDADCKASTNTDVDCALAGLPDFKQDRPDVQAYLNTFVNTWVRETGVDALRLDTMKHVPDMYWQQFFAAGGPGDPGKVWSVGEVFNGDPSVLAKYLRLGAPSVFDFPLYFAMKDQLTSANGNLDRVADVFAQDGVYPDASRLTTFVDNHDVPRFVSEAVSRGASAEEARARLDLALSLMYVSRGTPSVYYGTEIGLAGKGDPYNYPLGESNREDMVFSGVDASPLSARLRALADARRANPALTNGVQQELWRPNGGAPVLAFRRVLNGAAPVVTVLNGGNADLNLADLPGGGIPLLGTFAAGALREVTGRASDLRIEGGKLVGTLPARTLLAVTGAAGAGADVTVNPNLVDVTGLSAQGGDAAVQVRWTDSTDANVTGYRVYARAAGGSERLLNFAPLPLGTDAYLARGLVNGAAYTFRVVGVDAQGRESRGASVAGTPDSHATAKVTFTVDARNQGNGAVELRRFDTGQQITYPMTQVSRGVWKTDVTLPLFREVKFKFGNGAAGAKNSGYEGPGQSDRSVVAVDGAAYSGTYDYITQPAPTTFVEGTVTGAGAPLAGALVEGNDASLQYAFTFADGSYTLPAPGGEQTLRASAAGYTTSAPRVVTVPATGVSFDLARNLTGKYTVDGDLADWTAPKVNLSSPDAGVFGENNNLLDLRADSDDTFLYLAYRAKVAGNSAIVYVDAGDGGAVRADAFETWPRAASFGTGVDAFVAAYENQAPQLRRVTGDVATPEVNAGAYLKAARGTLPDQTVELAIPWTALGLSGRPNHAVNLYAGVFGGDGYGAGDIVPNATSTPAGANTIGSEGEQRRATFTAPLTFTP